MTPFGQWQPISTAPETGCANQVILLTEGKRGRQVHVGYFGYFDAQKSARKPKPYWRITDMEFLGVAWMRANQPIAWMPLPSTESWDPADARALWGEQVDRARASVLSDLETSDSPARNSRDAVRMPQSNSRDVCAQAVYGDLQMTSIDEAANLGRAALRELHAEGMVIFYTRDDGLEMVRLPARGDNRG